MDIDKDELMASIKKELEPEITKISFDTWIAPLGIKSIEGNNIVFTTTSEFQRDFIENKYRPLIFNTLRFITNKDWTFSVVDLSKEEDYNLARTKLDELKEQWLQDAAADINKVTTPDNSVVKDRLDTLKNMISVLQMDKNELMNVSEATKADDAFAEEIKSEEVNQAAADKYISEADEEFEKRMNSLPTPYCATY